MNKLWSIPLISLFFYLVTTITQHGFNSYFNIPANFIEVSLRHNIVYFYRLFSSAMLIAGIMQWWMWVVVIFAILTIIFLYNFDSIIYKILRGIFIIILLIILIKSFDFGYQLAKNTSSFYFIPSICVSGNEENWYIIPIIHDQNAVIVSVDKISNRMSNGFIVRDMADLGCVIEQNEIGKVVK